MFPPCASRMPASCCSRSCSPWTSSPDSNCRATTSDQDRNTVCVSDRFRVRQNLICKSCSRRKKQAKFLKSKYFCWRSQTKTMKCLVYVGTSSPLLSLYVYIINTKWLFRNQLLCVVLCPVELQILKKVLYKNALKSKYSIWSSMNDNTVKK